MLNHLHVDLFVFTAFIYTTTCSQVNESNVMAYLDYYLSKIKTIFDLRFIICVFIYASKTFEK